MIVRSIKPLTVMWLTTDGEWVTFCMSDTADCPNGKEVALLVEYEDVMLFHTIVTEKEVYKFYTYKFYDNTAYVCHPYSRQERDLVLGALAAFLEWGQR